MKKISKYLLLAASLLVLSCKGAQPINPDPEPVPDPTPGVEEMLFTGTLPMVKDDDELLTGIWSEGELVGLYAQGQTCRFKVQSVLGASKVKAAITGKALKSSEYLSLYPFDAASVMDAQGKIPFSLPATIDLTKNLPLYYIAQTEGLDLRYSLLQSFLKFEVGNDQVAKITISSESNALCGPATVFWDGEPKVSMAADAGHTITLAGKFPKGTVVVVPVPAGNYSDLTVTFMRADLSGADYTPKSLALKTGEISDLGKVEMSQWHDVGGSLYIYGPAAESGRKFTYIDNELYYKTSNGDYLDYVDKMDGPYFEIFTSLTAGAEFWFASSQTEQAQHHSVDKTGVYRIRVDAATGAHRCSIVNRATLFKSLAVQHTDLYYQGGGIWKSATFCTKWSKESWGVEDRFRFSLHFDESEQPLGINNPSISGGRPKADTPAEYYFVQPCKLGQWTGAFKYPDLLVDEDDNSKWFADVVLDLSGTSGHYTHSFENPRTLPTSGNAYRNPVFTQFSIPDPDVIRADDGYFYCMGTEHNQAACRNVPIMKSADLINWTKAGTLFTDATHPHITDQSNAGIWAPSINRIGDKYVCYYSQPGNNYKHAIGVATSDKPEGPYTDHGLLISSQEQGIDISIDAYLYQEDGRNYLFWGSFRAISVLELTADGLAIKDKATQKRVEVAGGQYEASVVLKRDGWYYLLCSTGNYAKGGTYHVVVGRSRNLLGPYVDRDGRNMMSVRHELVLEGNKHFTSPGHCSRIITDDAGEDWILYHTYVTEYDYRVMALDRIIWVDGWPRAVYQQATYGDTQKPYIKTK